MQVIPLILCTLFHVFLLLPHANAAATISKTITVNKNGGADFSSIQAAINSIPDYNNQWIKVQVAAGVYRSPSSPTLSFPYTSSTSPFRSRCREKVTVSFKGFILLQGEGAQQTSIEWGGYSGDAAGDDTATSATFTTYGANFVARDITFKNTYTGNTREQAVAVLVAGDKSSFYNCRFISVQDTLCDEMGRHYIKDCYIEGAIDFIWGVGQSIYEGCTISTVNIPEQPGYITAHGRQTSGDPSGFVFKSCNITGTGKTYLGRAWNHHARVLFHQTSMSDIVVPAGWDVWHQSGHENDITFAESGCTGPGSNHTGRISWAKKLGDAELQQLTSMSFIDSEGWLAAQP
ncbi:probable pectinesterase 66 [Musa acuminata AAA Group]|uniref:probable pectinesterase 66 n=1 Tax=Musa acuminata AAA Group TaxID=214697 RepID=UPI0031CDE8BC